MEPQLGYVSPEFHQPLKRELHLRELRVRHALSLPIHSILYRAASPVLVERLEELQELLLGPAQRLIDGHTHYSVSKITFAL